MPPTWENKYRTVKQEEVEKMEKDKMGKRWRNMQNIITYWGGRGGGVRNCPERETVL
jgi:hypothetical protein